VDPACSGEIDTTRPESEPGERDCRRQREAEPCSEPTELAGPVDTDRDPDLARGGAGQDARERDELAVLLLADPPAACDVLVVEIPDVRDGAAEGRQPETESGAEDLAGRSC
jgi:hypothetical protein